MKFSKRALVGIIKEEISKLLSEASEDEIGYIQDVIDAPIESLPFGDIFGDNYRLIKPFRTTDKNSALYKFEETLNRAGWGFKPGDATKAIKVYEILYIGNPKDGTKSRKISEEMSIQKFANEIVKFNQRVKQTAKQYKQLFFERQTMRKEKFGSMFANKPEYFLDNEFLSINRKIYSIEKSLKRFMVPRSIDMVVSNFQQLDSIFSEEREGLRKQRLTDGLALLQDPKSVEALAGADLDALKNKTDYIIFSRHPIDVFRMSDHEGLGSCHSLPSGKDEESFDEYNICALAEAHANGMIAYLVEGDEFESRDIEPNQETIDAYEDDELFEDDDRGEGYMSPVSRIRIRNIAVLDGDDGTTVTDRIAVPDGKSYGNTVAGFADFVYRIMANAQESKLKEIAKTGRVNMNQFLRVGGSYQDSNYKVSDNIPKLLNRVLPDGATVEYDGFVQYSSDLEQSLKDNYKPDSLGYGREEADRLNREYSNGNMEWRLMVEEDYDGGVILGGMFKIMYALGDDIVPREDLDDRDVSRVLGEAFEESKELYFADYNTGQSYDWASDLECYFKSSWAGRRNVLIIDGYVPSISTDDFDEQHFYHGDPDSWEAAIGGINDLVNRILDPHVEDSLNNYILAYAAAHYGNQIKSNSHNYVLHDLKDKFDEFGMFSISGVEEEDDMVTGGKVVRFSVEGEEEVDLGDFDVSLAPIITDVLANLASKGSNKFKATLVNSMLGSIYWDIFFSRNTTVQIKTGMHYSKVFGNQEVQIDPEQVAAAIKENARLNITYEITFNQDDYAPGINELLGLIVLDKVESQSGTTWIQEPEETFNNLLELSTVAAASSEEAVEETPPATDLAEIIRREVVLILKNIQ
tara:strand:- start:12961 stop:15549 length:2589 start_codon:yes stop_codon:yes gene_type:complete